MQRQYAETRHGKMSFLVEDGEYPLIFLHGLGGSANNWIRLKNYLEPRFKVIMIDMIGHGHSFQGEAEYTVKMQCEALQDLISSLNLERYTLIGNSFGGWVSLTFALRYGAPDNLVLIDSAGINPTVGEESKEQVERFLDRVMAMNKFNRRDVIRKIVLNNGSGKEKLFLEEFHDLKSRVAIIWGENDKMIDISYGRTLHENIKNSEFHVISGAGHVPHATHPIELSKILNEFILV